MKPYQTRLLDEKDELDRKLQALGKFLESDDFNAFHQAERTRLVEQEQVMRQYSLILGRRIECFVGDSK